MRIMKIEDKELDSINGGFSEQNKGLPTVGMSIECPRCHSKKAASFAKGALFDPEIKSVEYRCKCGCNFVCYGGNVLLKKDWLNLCKSKGLKYSF
jgi:DNA-directed RNA polymerase subunit M/transcription elongation factor TFIIS